MYKILLSVVFIISSYLNAGEISNSFQVDLEAEYRERTSPVFEVSFAEMPERVFETRRRTVSPLTLQRFQHESQIAYTSFVVIPILQMMGTFFLPAFAPDEGRTFTAFMMLTGAFILRAVRLYNRETYRSTLEEIHRILAQHQSIILIDLVLDTLIHGAFYEIAGTNMYGPMLFITYANLMLAIFSGYGSVTLNRIEEAMSR